MFIGARSGALSLALTLQRNEASVRLLRFAQSVQAGSLYSAISNDTLTCDCAARL